MTLGTYLLETNAASQVMRDPFGKVGLQLASLQAGDLPNPFCTSVVVQCELLFGLKRKSTRHWLERYEQLMGMLEVKALGPETPPVYAALRKALTDLGKPLDANDLLIAAHAFSLNATLVSANMAFGQVPGLKWENWAA